MRTIMSAVLGLAVVAGAGAASTVPANADSTVTISASEYNRLLRQERRRHRVERQIEYDANTLPIGSSIWWQQMDRERRGGRP